MVALIGAALFLPIPVWSAGGTPKTALTLNEDDSHYIHSSFWRKHPEYWRVPGGSSWTDRALDYGIPEVREHAMAFVRELLERYDPDGIELDWMRFGYYFRPGKEAEGATQLTRFIPAAQPMEGDITSTRGFAAACLPRGADSIYLFNCMDPAPMTGGKEACRTLLQEGLRLATVVPKPRRHVVTYHDTVAPGMSSDVVLPLVGFKGGTVRIYSGPAPKEADATVVAGLSQSDGIAESKFEIAINGKRCTPAADLADLSLFSGIARAVQHQCSQGSVRDGYNEIHIRQLPGEPEQKIAWMELRIVPR